MSGVGSAGSLPARRRSRAIPQAPDDDPTRPPRVHERLGFRLAFLLAVTLLPLGLIGLVQAGAWRDAAREQAAAALMGETLRAAAPAVGLIREAQGAAAAMAQAALPLTRDREACVAAMTALQAASPQYSIAAFVPVSGLMTCGSGGRSYDYRGTELFGRMVADGFAARVYLQARGPVSGVPVVLVVHPVTAPGGARPGYVALALPHAGLSPQDAPMAGADAGRPLPDLVTFDDAGTVLTASAGLGAEAAVLPVGMSLAALARQGSSTFRGQAATGERRDYAVVPVVPGTIHALGSLPVHHSLALGPVAAAAPVLFTTLMWATSLGVAWWAAERLVTRPTRGLARAIAAFAGGKREVDPLDMGAAPAELHAVAVAFRRMTDTILHDEAELEDGLRQREGLLREAHHRSKNNLQLIVSIMNLQARRVRTPEARTLMRGLQERVLNLAAVHRELYEATDASEIRADALLGDIARQIVGRDPAGGGRQVRLEADLACIPLVADQAVAVALFLTEALTGALARAGGPAPWLRVSLVSPVSPTGDARLTVEAGLDPEAAAAEPLEPDVDDQLLAAFAAQAGGRMEAGPSDGAWRLTLAFPLVPA